MGCDYQASEAPEQSRTLAGDVLVGLIASIAAIAVSFSIASGAEALFGALLAGLMLYTAAYDRRLFIIPDLLVACTAGLGFVRAALLGSETFFANCLPSLIRGLAALAVFWVIRTAYGLWRKREGIGLGDVKLAFVAGVWLGWSALIVSVDLAAFSALGAILFSAARGHYFRRDSRLPFGLFFAPAIWLAWVFETVMA